MKRSTLTRVQILLVVVLAVLVFVRLITGPPDPSGLVVLVDIEPNELRHGAFEVQEPAVFTVQATGSFDPAAVPADLAARGWIVRRSDRTVVWQMEPTVAEPGRGHTAHIPGDTFALDPGVYDVYFASYGATFDGHQNRWRRDDDEWQLVLRVTSDDARVRALPDTRQDRLAPEGDDLVWTSAPLREDREETYLFDVQQPTHVRLYAVGEIENEAQDYAWIENAVTGERVWEMTKANTEPAGGLPRNRVFRGEVTLDAGTYRAVSVSNDDHAFYDWEGNPPFDPPGWGLSIFADDPGALSTFDPWNARKPIIQFTRVPDDAERRQRFEVTEPLQVVVYGVGEITRDGSAYDFGELLKEEAGYEETIWHMSRDASVHAGGGDKNRREVVFLHLDPGVYVLRYETDGSHAYDDWNTSRPENPERWGVTLFPMADALSEGAVRLLSDEEKSSYSVTMSEINHDGPPVIAWTELGNDTVITETFELDHETALHVVALGEITRSGQHDYGWIEQTETGDVVWEMTLDNTRSGGGTSRNRRFDGVIQLPAGSYAVHYRTDFSHAYGDFGNEEPAAPEAWGLTIYRVAEETEENN